MTRSARWARIVHVGSLVILALVLLAIGLGSLAGEEGGGDTDPFYLVLVIVVVGGFSTLGRLIVTRAGNVLGWVFLVMGAALALGLPAEGYLDVAFREPYVAEPAGHGGRGGARERVPGRDGVLDPDAVLALPHRFPADAPLALGDLGVAHGDDPQRDLAAFPSRERLRGDRQVQDPEPARPRVPAAARTAATQRRGGDRPRVGGGGLVSLVVRFRRARGEERQQITWLLLSRALRCC